MFALEDRPFVRFFPFFAFPDADLCLNSARPRPASFFAVAEFRPHLAPGHANGSSAPSRAESADAQRIIHKPRRISTYNFVGLKG
jgi:hypothetical protein